MKEKTLARALPFSLTLAVILADQLTKWIVTATVRPWSVGFSLFGDFFRIIRVYNPGIAFSLGSGLSSDIRAIVFGLIPLAVIVVVAFVYFRSDDLNRLQRWCITGIIGGGLGNLLDRFFRPEGVLDFLDVKFYGLFGLERWPTFNVADSSVVVCGIILMISLFMTARTADAETEEGKKQ